MKMTNALKIQKYCTAAANNAPMPPIMPFARKEATAPWTAVQTLTFRPAVKPTIPTIAPFPTPTAATSDTASCLLSAIPKQTFCTVPMTIHMPSVSPKTKKTVAALVSITDINMIPFPPDTPKPANASAAKKPNIPRL